MTKPEDEQNYQKIYPTTTRVKSNLNQKMSNARFEKLKQNKRREDIHSLPEISADALRQFTVAKNFSRDFVS
jgi:hypothetical protein